jgi:hypothetical protein
METETEAFLRALLPALDKEKGQQEEAPAAGKRPRFHALAIELAIGSGYSDKDHAGELRVYRPRFHALAIELAIGSGYSDKDHAGELRVYIASSQAEIREIHVEEWTLARFEARAGVAQPPFVAETRHLVTGCHPTGEAERGAPAGDPYPLDELLDAMGRALLKLAAGGELARHGFVARPVLSAFVMEELEWMEGSYTVPTERMTRLRRKK